MNGIPEGFELCDQCRTWHRPASSVCQYKLEADADFVLDAAGGALTISMIERVLRELDIKESYRYVSPPHQRQAYLLTGMALSKGITGPWGERASDGAQWVTRVEYPPDVLMIESDGGLGLIKSLQVPADRTPKEEGE